MSSDAFLDSVYAAIQYVLPTFRHLAPEGTKRPYCVLNVLPGAILRCFNDAESLERMMLQVTLWYDWTQDDAEAQADADTIQAALDMKEMGGILLRVIGTPGFYVVDTGERRRALQVVLDFLYERVRVLDSAVTTTS